MIGRYCMYTFRVRNDTPSFHQCHAILYALELLSFLPFVTQSLYPSRFSQLLSRLSSSTSPSLSLSCSLYLELVHFLSYYTHIIMNHLFCHCPIFILLPPFALKLKNILFMYFILLYQ